MKFDNSFKIVWKKHYYSKQDKKLKPILTLTNNGKILVVFDNISKFYALNLETGNLIWSKTSYNPSNSQIKILNNQIYSIDLNNVLRSFSLLDGKELWSFKSENTFLKSTKINSIAVSKNLVIFNNSVGDIIALDAKTGSLIWQTPTQSSDIYENAFSLIMSDLVVRDTNLIFSNNINEFYSINIQNGLINWQQKINSNIRPGYFFVINF